MPKTPAGFIEGARGALADEDLVLAERFRQYCGELLDDRGLDRYLRSKHQLVALAGGVAGKDVLDAGSGFGMTANLLAAWGARRVLALELLLPWAVTHRRILSRHFPRLAAVEPIAADAAHLPVRSGSLDLVLSIEAISHYVDVDGFLAECARVLRPGGHLLISDGNNGANPRIRRVTESLWERFENGPPGDFHGVTIQAPMRDRRAGFIRERFPLLRDEQVRALAENTSGFDYRQIETAVAGVLNGDPAPSSRYVPRTCPRDPEQGYVMERLFDPRALARTLGGLGFEARAIPHYGGAGNDLVLAVNSLLRRVPSFRFARAYRIVARRR